MQQQRGPAAACRGPPPEAVGVHAQRAHAGDIPAEGCGTMADHELVANIAGVAPHVGQRVLDRVGGLAGMRRAGRGLFCQIDGIGPSRAGKLLASVELGRRMLQGQARARPKMGNAAQVADYMRPRLAHLDHEEMWVLALDGRNRLRGARRVAQGGRHGLAVTAREILSAALLDAASGFVLVHNHPSGSAEPSREDVAMTDAVAAAAAVVGVPLLDHVIVTGATHSSLLVSA